MTFDSAGGTLDLNNNDAIIHSGDISALTAAVRFVSTWKRRLPASLLDKVQTALLTLNPKSPIIGELKWDQIREEKDLQRRATLCREFLQSYPKHDYTQSAYVELFETVANQIKDEAAAEKAFEDWRAFEPGVADVPAAMGRFYVDQKLKPEKAVELLTTAIELCQGQAKNPVQRSGITRRIMVGCGTEEPVPPQQLRLHVRWSGFDSKSVQRQEPAVFHG
jgi:hypothetical protein